MRRGAAPTPDDRLTLALTSTFADDEPVWRFGVVAIEQSRAVSPALLAEELARDRGVTKFSIMPVRIP